MKDKEMLSMAFYDWNHDGNKDFMDDYLEYNIYKKSTGNNSSNSSIKVSIVEVWSYSI